MNVAAGTRLGPYEVIELLGKGGMGEVYKARDTRLDRFVAVKVLPPEWMHDPAMKERFDREAKAIASLNHPNICALHDVGQAGGQAGGGVSPASLAGTDPTSYLVMELLQGETLAARIARGPMDLDEALDVAVPIADALDQAHRRGVIHRDLKPGNIMLTKTGPKLLDFGLARTPVMGARKSSGSGESGTIAVVPTTPLTVPGLLIGTLQYMAPEQLDGLEADARTDIFTFGAILHEMITGKRAFEGKSQVLLISSIATNDPPPLSRVQPATPPALEHVVRTCLAKDPDDRWQTARDLLAELKWIAGGGAAASAVMPVGERPRRRRAWLLPALAVLGLAVAAALAVPAYSYFEGPPAPAELRYRLWAAPFVDAPDASGSFALSADGRQIAFRARQSGTPEPAGLYVGRVGELNYLRLPSTELAGQPFWSGDGAYVGFVLGGNRLMRVNLTGDRPQEITRHDAIFGGDWNQTGVIVFGSPEGIQRVSAEGGAPELLVPNGNGQTGSYWPRFLPGGRRFLYLAWSGNAKDAAIMVASLDDPTPIKVMSAQSNAFFSDGYLIFHRGDTVFAHRMDPESLQLSGESVRLAAGVPVFVSAGRGAFVASWNGTVVYAQSDGASSTAGLHESRVWQTLWVDRSAQIIKAIGSYQRYRGIEVSPDGTRLAMHRHEDIGGDVYITEPSGTESRLTFEPARENSSPIWSPDGQYVVYGARKDAKFGLFRRLADSRGTEELLYESDRLVTPMSWSRDGKRLVFTVRVSESNSDLWVLTLESADGAVSTSEKPQAFASSPADETHGQISNDGHWLAYASNEKDPAVYEVYVRPFPAGAGKRQISIAGGRWPRWSRDGKELLFMLNVPDNQTSETGSLRRVTFSVKGDAFVHEPEQEFLRFRALNLSHPGGDFPTYAVGDKGTVYVFSLVTPPAAATSTVVAPDQETGNTVLHYWQPHLRKK